MNIKAAIGAWLLQTLHVVVELVTICKHDTAYLEAILLKFGMWPWATDSGGHVHKQKLFCFIKAAWSCK